MLVPFGNGLCTGAALNYTLVHSLHITPAATHFIISSLVTTFRGFGASFGSAVGGGIFARALTAAFYEMSEKRGLERDGELLRKLLGTPAIIGTLEGVWKEVAVESFVAAFRSLFVAGGCLALGFVVVQAGTGWNGAHLPSVEDGSEI